MEGYCVKCKAKKEMQGANECFKTKSWWYIKQWKTEKKPWKVHARAAEPVCSKFYLKANILYIF